MTSILKTDDELREIDPNDPQGDLFVTPDEIEAARAAIAARESKATTEDTRTPDEKRRDEWKARWDASKDGRAQPAASDLSELAHLRAEFAELKQKQYETAKKLKEASEELARAKETIARAARAEDTIVIAGRHNNATIDVEVKPKMLVTIEVDSDCGCIKHARPSDFQFAITQAGSVYVRTTDRELGKFFRTTRAGVTRLRVVSERVIVPDEPATLVNGPEL